MTDAVDNQANDQQDVVDKIKTKGVASKFFNQFPESLSRIQDDLGGKTARLQTLQDRNKFLADQMKMLEGQLKLYSTLNQTNPTQPVQVPQELVKQIGDLNQEILKNGSAYKEEFNNIKPLPPDPNSTSLSHNGENVPVDSALLGAVKSGDPRVFARLQQMQSSDDPQVRKQAEAIGTAVGQGIADQQQTMFKDNGEVDSAPVPPNAATPGQPMPPQTPGAPPAENNQGALSFIKNSLSGNSLSSVEQSGPAGAVEAIRRSLISNVQKGKQ